MEQATEQRGGAAPAEHYHYEVVDATPARLRALKQSLMGAHWTYQTQMLEILEWVCVTDRQFERARRRALDIINGQERAMSAVLAAAFPPEASDARAR